MTLTNSISQDLSYSNYSIPLNENVELMPVNINLFNLLNLYILTYSQLILIDN